MSISILNPRWVFKTIRIVIVDLNKINNDTNLLWIFQDPSPQIFIEEDRYGIWMEGNELCTAGDMVEAVAVWFSTFYIFNIHFPIYAKNTLTFIQKVLLKLNDKVKMSSKVFNLMKSIEALLEKWLKPKFCEVNFMIVTFFFLEWHPASPYVILKGK